jgi:signal transduction histidine kinase
MKEGRSAEETREAPDPGLRDHVQGKAWSGVFILNFYKGRELKIADVPLDGRVTIGRDPDNVVILNDSSVSRHHATIFVDEDCGTERIVLRDEGSTNGCEVNGQKVRRQSILVQPEDVIKIGSFRLEVLEKSGLPPDGRNLDQTVVYDTPPLWRESLPIDRLRALYDFASGSTQLETEELLALAAKKVAACLEFDVLCIVLQSSAEKNVVRTWDKIGPCPASQVTMSRAVIERCLRENVSLLADNREGAEEMEPARGGKAPSCAICVPLSSGDGLLGAVYIDSKSSSVIYAKEDLQFLLLVANTLASNISIRRVLQDLRAEAEKLEAILESLKEGVLILDRDFSILSTNTTAKSILGREALVGMRLEEALSGLRHTFHPRALPGRACFQLETKPDGKPGASRSVYSATVSKNTGNDQAGWQYVICFHDITQAQCMERMKAMLINRLAHKLRTPLTVITGVNGLIAQQAGKHLDAELRNLLQQSAKQSEECAAMIERFVEYTSLNLKQGGSFDPYETCPLEELVAAAIEANSDLITKTGFKVSRRFPRETYSIQGDESKLRLVFHHVLQNAVKFGRPGGMVEIDAVESEGTITIAFVDDGPGIPPREMEYVFQMLHQVDMEETGEVPGAGLGLWFARDIVQAHGGSIQITSPAQPGGGGTKVEIRLPASTPDQAATREAERKKMQTIRLATPARQPGG